MLVLGDIVSILEPGAIPLLVGHTQFVDPGIDGSGLIEEDSRSVVGVDDVQISGKA